MLLEGSDLQRRSRHIDIKVNWLRELLGKEILQIGHVRGTGNVADHFTKCLPTIKALQYMEILGRPVLRLQFFLSFRAQK